MLTIKNYNSWYKLFIYIFLAKIPLNNYFVRTLLFSFGLHNLVCTIFIEKLFYVIYNKNKNKNKMVSKMWKHFTHQIIY